MNIQKIAKTVKEEETEYFNKIELSSKLSKHSMLKLYFKKYSKILIFLNLPLSIIASWLSFIFFGYSFFESIVIFFVTMIILILNSFFDYRAPNKKMTDEEMIESFYNSLVSEKILDMLKIELNQEQYKVLKYSSIYNGLTYYKLVDFLKEIENVNQLIKCTSDEQYLLNVNNINGLNIINYKQ